MDCLWGRILMGATAIMQSWTRILVILSGSRNPRDRNPHSYRKPRYPLLGIPVPGSLYKDPQMGWGKGKYTGKGMGKGAFVPLFVQKGNARQDSHAKLHLPWKSYFPQKMLRTSRTYQTFQMNTVRGGPARLGKNIRGVRNVRGAQSVRGVLSVPTTPNGAIVPK